MRKTKKLSHKSLLGQYGANHIERIINEMGQVWRPTTVHDTGVDGTLEFRDVGTGEVSNQHIQIQSKATDLAWEAENAISFTYRARQEDLDYWLRGNLPVILIVSRPKDSVAYWISINQYFADAKAMQSRKIIFNKKENIFDVNCLSKLQLLASTVQAGYYTPPLRKSEELVTNLLPVSHFPKTLYIAETTYRKPKELNDWLLANNVMGKREWILRNERIYSFHDLSHYPWTEICDRGTLEDFDTREWSDSDDPDKLREWVELLNALLRNKLGTEAIVFNSGKQFKFYYFKNWEGKTREYKYLSQSNNTDREVVKKIINKKTNELMCFRHSAVETNFHRFDGLWYLRIAPTYFYTLDGKQPYMYHEDQLAGIKRLEHNESVLGQTIMWERILTDAAQSDLYKSSYHFLKFEALIRQEVNQGIDDSLWLPVADNLLEEELQNFGGLL